MRVVAEGMQSGISRQFLNLGRPASEAAWFWWPHLLSNWRPALLRGL